MSLAFRRTVEDFICGQCGQPVQGNGYTNHCPACLYSKHVDVNPGDRAASCGGLMKPLRVEISGRDWFIVQQCLACGFQRRNKVGPADNREALIALGA